MNLAGALTTIPVALRKRSIRAGLSAALDAISLLVRPVKPVFRNLYRIPFTVCALGILDGDLISWNTHIGLLITAISLVFLEHILADER